MLTDNDLKSYIKSYYLDRKMTYTKLDIHDRAIGVLLEENKQLKETIDKAIEYIKNHQYEHRIGGIGFINSNKLLEILGDKE